MHNGLVVGKFCPLHKGHEELLNFAKSQCKTLYIISYTKPEFSGCEPDKRRVWLEKLYPKAKILILDDNISNALLGRPVPHNDDGEEIHRDYCAKICRDYFNILPDSIFTCESYGDGFAEHLSKIFLKPIKHMVFGSRRAHNSISGTKIRENVHLHKNYLSPTVYADFVKTVCFLGAESTGKSSLSELCARKYCTHHVDEFGRTLWEQRKGQLALEDMLVIANEHISAEQKAYFGANEFLFIDTSPLTTLFYSLSMFGKADPELYQHAQRQYDHVFLCAPDFPLVQDGTRQNEDFRTKQHAWYLQELAERKIPYTFLTGSLEDRQRTVECQLRAGHKK